MSCCWSKAAVDVVGHEFNTELETIFLRPDQSLVSSPQPVLNESLDQSICTDYVDATAQVDYIDKLSLHSVQRRYQTKSPVGAISDLLQPHNPFCTENSFNINTANAPDDSLIELHENLSECGTEFHESEASALHAAPEQGADSIGSVVSLASDIINKSYFPLITDLKSGELFAFNGNQPGFQDHGKSEWLCMPGFDFLPKDVVDIIAGGGGLLCVNGGIQPRKRNTHTPPIPHADDYNLGLYPQQSILVVCNPLTKEMKFLPRHTNKKLEDKIACLEILQRNSSSSDDKSTARLRYRVHIVGSHHERSSLSGQASDELILMTYDSRSDTWISGMAVGRTKIPSLSKTGIARREDGFYLGGQEEVEEVSTSTWKASQGRGTERMSRRQHSVAAMPRGRRTWINKIFYVQASTLKWHSVDFEIVGEDGMLHPEPLQAPRVVQCRAGGPVYAVTRALEAAKTIEIYEVEIVNGFPTGVFNPVTKMPDDIFMNLFESETSMREYDCAADYDYICFLVDPPNQSTIGVCDLGAQRWFMSIFPSDPNGNGHYALSKSHWSPNPKARP